MGSLDLNLENKSKKKNWSNPNKENFSQQQLLEAIYKDEYGSFRSLSEVEDFRQQYKYTSFLNKPRTLTALFLVLMTLVHVSNVLQPENDDYFDTTQQYRRGVFGVIAVFLVYSVLQGPSTKLVRPHPAVWKLVHGVTLIYLLFLTFLLFLTVQDARQFMKNLDPRLGVDLPERSYGSDCRLYIKGQGINWQILQDTIWDEFVIAHTLGWWGKALIMRNQFMLWSVSVLFEVMEQTFKHMMPNFNECWWDSWLLDVAICNVIGIFTGMATVRHFRSHTYDWRGLDQRGVVGKAKRSIMQFTPKTLDNYQWSIFSSPKRCLQCMVLIVAALTIEVNAFFLKFVLWVPPSCQLNVYRLIIHFLVAIPATHEYYEFIQRPNSSVNDAVMKLGSYAWLGFATVLMELLVIFKFSRGLFLEPWPAHVQIAWGVVGGLFIITLLGWQFIYFSKSYKKDKLK